MSDRIRIIVLAVTTFVILTMANLQIAGKEEIVSEGRTILLRLAPVDPRSLMQGDYMALRYRMTNDVLRAVRGSEVRDGIAIVQLDDLGAASFVSLYDGQQLTAAQAVLQFRKRGESVRVASDAFFFEEGLSGAYAGAIYGEVRVDASGSAVLTGLRDREGQRLGSALHETD